MITMTKNLLNCLNLVLGQDLYANYRAVSVLPIFSKFLEKVVHKRLYNFLIKYNIMFDNQCGFRKNHSTALALLHLICMIH